MKHRNRREFLAEVGQGMLIASVGSALARVTASECGYLATGYVEACSLMKK